ncbi:MAG TPA: FtsX-like permease family protein [Victivallales bacterium]|mgnify:CR=1 FL=1|nr:FtsX-like permease family protein [Victivallales bacterium]
MKMILKLIFSGIFKHPARLIFCCLAMIASSGIVVWIVSGYDALLGQFKSSARISLGRYHMMIVPKSSKNPIIDKKIFEDIKRDNEISEIEPVMQCLASVSRSDGFTGAPLFPQIDEKSNIGPRQRFDKNLTPGKNTFSKKEAERKSENRQDTGSKGTMQMPQKRENPIKRMRSFAKPVIVGIDAGKPPIDLKAGLWLEPGSSENEAVISSGLADKLEVEVGDKLLVKSSNGEFSLKIIGILEQQRFPIQLDRDFLAPDLLSRSPAILPVYVPMRLAEKINNGEKKISIIYLILKDNVSPIDFMEKWRKNLISSGDKAEIYSLKDIEGTMERNRMAYSVKMQAYSATALSLMASIFIIFTTLNMGVHERIRQFAILRIVAFTRLQVAMMIIIESLFLGFIGWFGGLLSGLILLNLLQRSHPELFQYGVSLGTFCVSLSGISAFGGALAASIIPAVKVAKLNPIDVFTPSISYKKAQIHFSLFLWAIILIALNPLLFSILPLSEDNKYPLIIAGFIFMGIGFILLIPILIIIVEKAFLPIISRFLLLHSALLNSQLTINLWRTFGTTVSLSIGLSLYIATVTWGYSMLQPFIPGEWVPDMLLFFRKGGLLQFEIENVRLIKGIKAEKCVPLAVEQPKLADDITHSEEKSSVTRQDNVIIIGIDPEIAFSGDSPLLPLKFINSSANEVVALLKKGRYCIVPDHFLKASKLKVGDKFTMIPPESPNPVEYIIAGAVSLPGWHWMTKFSGLRRRSGRTAAMIFADYETVRSDFKIEKINFIWTNIEKNADIEKIGLAVQEIADRNLGPDQPVNMQGMWNFGARNYGKSLRITLPIDIRERINSRADGMIWAMCQLPLITLLISSFAVINTVLASVRARRWEMGVLRAIGVTRFELIRLILAEVIMIAIVASLLSLIFGVLSGYSGVTVSQFSSFFGGLTTSLYIPFKKIFICIGFTILLSIIAAILPAIYTGKSEILRLLNEGRACM